jgi:hypothetical protein
VRQNYQNNHDYYLKYESRRNQTTRRRAQWPNQVKRQRARNPEKYKARQIVGNAIRDSRLSKQPCAVCGSIDRLEAHHNDYSAPLNIQWLCFKHHREVAHGERTSV